MNGGAIRATLIFLLNNTTKMPNPTLVIRKAPLLRFLKDSCAFSSTEALLADEINAEIRILRNFIQIKNYVAVKARNRFEELFAISTACSNSWARTSLVCAASTRSRAACPMRRSSESS